MMKGESGRIIEDFIEDKYGSGGPDAARFEPDPTEVHASQVASCERRQWWEHERNPTTEPSVYFELGRMYERMYGRALSSTYEDWRFMQDLGATIRMGRIGGEHREITGESDWVILRQEARDLVDEHGQPDEVELLENRNRAVHFPDGHVEKYGQDEQTCVARVDETKTTGNLRWIRSHGHKKKHEYQLAVYQMAFRSPGDIVYMERDDATEWRYSFPHRPEMDLDIRVRAKQRFETYESDELPDTSPLDEDECHWCEFENECQAQGGSIW